MLRTQRLASAARLRLCFADRLAHRHQALRTLYIVLQNMLRGNRKQHRTRSTCKPLKRHVERSVHTAVTCRILHTESVNGLLVVTRHSSIIDCDRLGRRHYSCHRETDEAFQSLDVIRRQFNIIKPRQTALRCTSQVFYLTAV